MPIEDQSQLSPAHQSCRDCCFAAYEGETQTGCSLGRLDAFRALGLEVVEACDHEKNFFVVDGRKCNAFRGAESDWARRTPDRDRAAAVRREITPKIDVLVHAGDFPSEQGLFDALAATLHSLETQDPRPQLVVVVSNQSTVKVSFLNAWLAVNAAELNWRLNVVLERLPDGSRLPAEAACCLTAGKLSGHFLGFCGAGAVAPAGLTAWLDRAVNDELRQVGVVAAGDSPPAKSTGRPLTLVARGLYSLLRGNEPVGAEEIGLEGGGLATLEEKLFLLGQQKPHLFTAPSPKGAA